MPSLIALSLTHTLIIYLTCVNLRFRQCISKQTIAMKRANARERIVNFIMGNKDVSHLRMKQSWFRQLLSRPIVSLLLSLIISKDVQCRVIVTPGRDEDRSASACYARCQHFDQIVNILTRTSAVRYRFFNLFTALAESPKDALRSHAQSDGQRRKEVPLRPVSNNLFAFGRIRSSVLQIRYPMRR